MNEYNKMLFFTVALLLSGCSEKDNPVTPPAIEVMKNGIISKAEAWTETGKVYRVTADCSIEAQVTWGKGIVVVVDPASAVRIENNGALTIEENVTVKLREGAYILAGDLSPGTLIATGSASAPIVFKADAGAQSWGLSGVSRSGGILLGDSANNSRLSYCTITGAAGGIYVAAGSPLISGCKISSCKGNGIYFDSAAGPADSSTFTNNTVSDCNGYPLTLPANKLGNFSGEIIFSGSGGKNAIHVLGAKVEDTAAVWKKRSLPYIFKGMTLISSFMMTSRVTIMPGVVCKFEKDACIKVGDPRFGSGILKAIGTPIDSIFFVNNPPDNIWGDSTAGILIGPESPANTILEYCSIQNATTGIFVNMMITRVTVSHCRVTGCDSSGITFAGGGPVDSLAFLDNFCVKNYGYGISATADQLTNLSGIGSVAENGKGGIYVTGAEVWQSGSWKKYDAPYIVDGVIDVGSSGGVAINISPGTEFDFLPGASIRVGNSAPGSLAAIGSVNFPIVFTSFAPGVYWGAGADGASGGGIRIEKFADAKTELTRCNIQRATSGVYVNASAKIQGCIFRNNRYYGLVVDKNANPALIFGNSYLGNGADSVYVVQ